MQPQSKILSWPEWRQHLKDDEAVRSLVDSVPNFEDVEVPDKYMDIWRDISLKVQLRKAKNHQLTSQQTEECLQQLCKRPYYLVSLAKKYGVKNIVEVGTAEGLQFFSFANYLSDIGGKIWSCDIKDVRNKEYKEKFEDTTNFCLGNSEALSKVVKESIDMFYIDGAHDYGSVVRDVVNLKKLQSENPIWIFDDFDERFGCYRDIKRLCEMKKVYKVYRVGNAGSGNPNHQVIIFGKL